MTFFVISLFNVFYCYTPFTPLLHTPTCCFSRFYALLCALLTINTIYAIYFFLINHCTNSLSSLHIFVHHCTFCASLPWAETWRRIWGTQKNFRGPISGKISIFRVKISDDLFLVIDLVLRIYPFFSHIFRMFTMLNVVYDHFLTRKPQFFTLFILSRTSDNTTSQNIGGTNAWAVPPPQIWGDRPPVPLGLRPWFQGYQVSRIRLRLLTQFNRRFPLNLRAL